MIHSEIQLTLSITRDAEPDTHFCVQLYADGKPLSLEHRVTEESYRAIHHLSDGCRQLLKSGGNPSLSADTLTTIGTELFAAWLEPFWLQTTELLDENPGQPCHITITSSILDILFLPWELLQFPSGVIPGLDSRFGLRRLPKSSKSAARCCPTLPPGPLRLLFMATAPTNSGELDFMAEERSLRHSLLEAGREICLQVVDSGTFAELKSTIHQFQPHIVHLAGPALIKNETGYFGFEDEIGNADIRSAAELSNDLFANSGVQAVILSGRDGIKPSPVAALGAVALELVDRGIPLALGWGESLSNPLAATFTQTLYSTLAAGKSIDQALSESRCTILKKCESSGYPGWIIPMLFASTNQCRLFNNSPEAPRIHALPMINNLPPIPGLALGPVLNYRLQRQESQRLLPQLLDGSLQTLLLTGPEGSGKSTLASHLANNLGQAEFSQIAISGTANTPLTTARILAAFEQSLRQAELKDELEVLLNPGISMEDRLGFIAALMNRHSQFVMIWDGLEWSLDPETKRFIDPTMAPFFFYMLDQINGKSRFIATSRVTPISGGPAPLPATYREEKLSTLHQSPPKPLGLDEKDQSSLCRAAMFNHPVPAAGIAAIIDASLEKSEKLLKFWQKEGLAYLDETGGTTVWHIIHPLPDGITNLDDETITTVHKAAGDYLLTQLQSRQIDTLQLSWLDIATETINHLLLANAFEQAVVVADPINTFLEQMGFYWEMEQINSKLLENHEHPGPLYKIALAKQRQGFLPDAAATLEKVLSMTGGKNVKEEALAMFELASMELQRGAIPAALKRFDAALKINRAIKDEPGIAACLIQTGIIYMHSGEGKKALSPFDEALKIQRRSGTSDELAQFLPWIADVHFRHGDVNIARGLFNEVLPLLREQQNRPMEAQILQQLATIDLNEKQHHESLKGFQLSINIKRELDDKKGEAATFFQLGRLAKAVGHQDSCMRFIGLCHLIDLEIGSPDAEQERKIFDEIVGTIGLNKDIAKDVLEEVWSAYKLDRGQELIDRTFEKLMDQKKIIPIKVV
jgi:tetratricopeptide (TPR) repeat protein